MNNQNRHVWTMSPVIAVGVIDDTTPVQARDAIPTMQQLFTSNARGVLVRDVSGLVTVTLSMKLGRRSFTLFYNRLDETFMCTVWRPDQEEDECFAVGRPTSSYKVLDSILGETTLEGILRVLDIPRSALYPDEDATEGGWQPPYWN
jgi:hypothetical protein